MPRLSVPLLAVQAMLAALSLFPPRTDPLSPALAAASLLVCGLNLGAAWVRRAIERG